MLKYFNSNQKIAFLNVGSREKICLFLIISSLEYSLLIVMNCIYVLLKNISKLEPKILYCEKIQVNEDNKCF
jgi:hypothetical protein